MLSNLFANSMMEGLYNLEQYVHARGHRLIARNRLGCVFLIYATVTDFNPQAHPFLHKVYLSLKATNALPSNRHRGAVLGAVMFREMGYDEAVSLNPGVHVHKNASQLLHVERRWPVNVPVCLRTTACQRFDRWFPLQSAIIPTLMAVYCGMLHSLF